MFTSLCLICYGYFIEIWYKSFYVDCNSCSFVNFTTKRCGKTMEPQIASVTKWLRIFQVPNLKNSQIFDREFSFFQAAIERIWKVAGDSIVLNCWVNLIMHDVKIDRGYVGCVNEQIICTIPKHEWTYFLVTSLGNFV